MAEIIPNDYTKEYNEAIQRIIQLEKDVSDAYVFCEHICRSAGASNWSIQTPEQMAEYCASQINGLAKGLAKGRYYGTKNPEELKKFDWYNRKLVELPVKSAPDWLKKLSEAPMEASRG